MMSQSKRDSGNYKPFTYFLISFLLMGLLSCKPISDFHKELDYSVTEIPENSEGDYNDTLKTVILIADHRSTEIFDLLSPYYLFSSSGEANVYIVSKEEQPINLFRGLMVMPHYSFETFRSLGISPDLIVIPNLSSVEKEKIDPDITDFIRSQFVDGKTSVLSVCDGAAVASQTGLFDGFKITTHSSDLDYLAKQWPQLEWEKGLKVIESNGFYSTAGVSNATEGSLVVMKSLFGHEVANRVAEKIYFSFDSQELDKTHQPIGWSDKYQILKKVLFKDNKKVGFMLTEGISELSLAGMLDTYSRTFPENIGTFSLDGRPVNSENGLVLIPTETAMDFDEIHVFEKSALSGKENVKDHSDVKEYVFDYSLSLIENEFGSNFKNAVIKLLDYEYQSK
ncbi:DJ-1/PfpI family protein [Algoriphagus marincola]|uniref:DJ-1/PfpI family protein n=1 Tax=Algoriphagus marincola TaxID=264027 RepID=UPI00041E4AC9|nr:DJ-1/PfpI family protein [Algoriphagus marincola]